MCTSVSQAVSVSVCRHFAVCHIMLWNCCCCCVFPQRRDGGERRGELHYFQRAFWAMCGCVDRAGISGSARVGESERKRGVSACLRVQSVVKCSASKRNRSWEQKPFPKSHSHNPNPPPPLFLLSHSHLLFFCVLQCQGCLSLCLISAFVQSFIVAESSVNVRPPDCDLQGTQKTKWWHNSSERWEDSKRERSRWNRKTKSVWRGNKNRGEKTSKGKRKGSLQGYSLCLGPENSVWHHVWHLTVMSLPVRWCVGNKPVSFRFSGDSCLSFVGILVVSDRQHRSEVICGLLWCRRYMDILDQWFPTFFVWRTTIALSDEPRYPFIATIRHIFGTSVMLQIS